VVGTALKAEKFFSFLNKILEGYPKRISDDIKTNFLTQAIQSPRLSTMGRINGLAVIAQRKGIKLEIPENCFTLLYKRLNEKQLQTKETAIGVMAYIIPFLSVSYCEKALERLVVQVLTCDYVLNLNGDPIKPEAFAALEYVVPRIDAHLISFLFNHIDQKLKGGNYISHSTVLDSRLLEIMTMIGGRLDKNQVAQAFNKITAKFIHHQQSHITKLRIATLTHIEKLGIAVLTAMISQFTEPQATQFMKIIADKLTKKNHYREVLRDAVLALSQSLSSSQIELFSSELIKLLPQQTDKDKDYSRSLLLCHLIVLIPYLNPESEQFKLILTELNALFKYWSIIKFKYRSIIDVLPEYLVDNASIEILIQIAIDELEKQRNEECDLIRMPEIPIKEHIKNIVKNQYIIADNGLWFVDCTKKSLEVLLFLNGKSLLSLLKELKFVENHPATKAELRLITSYTGHTRNEEAPLIRFLLEMTPKAPNKFKSYLKKLAQQELLNPLSPRELMLGACAFHEIQLNAFQVIDLIKQEFGSFARFSYLYRVNLERLFSKLNPTENDKVMTYLEKELEQVEGLALRKAINALTLMVASLTEKQHNLFLEKAARKMNNENWAVRQSILQFFTASASRFTSEQVLSYLNHGIEKLKDTDTLVCKSALQLISTLIPRINDANLLNLYKKVAPLLGVSDSGVRQEAVQLLSCLTCKNIGSLEPMNTDYSEYTLMEIIQNMWSQIKETQPSLYSGRFFNNTLEVVPVENISPSMEL
jgi:hypothetical protein